MNATSAISTITDLIDDLRAGRMVVLIDEEDRENEGDLVLAADFVTPEAINFMARYGRGLICLTLTEGKCRDLNLPLMVSNNRAPHGTAFTVSIEAAQGVTTGISAADRAQTVRAAVRADARPEDVVQPGHVFPLMAQNGGVLVRAGHTEAGCDLAGMAACTPAAVICEILREDGSMARLPDLIPFAKVHGLRIGTIADLIQYRSRTERIIVRVAERALPTAHGEFRLVAYRDKVDNGTHLALVRGSWAKGDEVLVRVHEPLSVMDLLDAGVSEHSWKLGEAMAAVTRAGRGVIVLLYRPESAADLLARAQGITAPPIPKNALRTYGIGAQILKDLGVSHMRLMAKPRRMPSMAGFDLQITGYLEPGQTPAPGI